MPALFNIPASDADAINDLETDVIRERIRTRITDRPKSSLKFYTVLADFIRSVTKHADEHYPDASFIRGDYALSADDAYQFRMKKDDGAWVLMEFLPSKTRASENVRGCRYLEACVGVVAAGDLHFISILADLYNHRPMPEDDFDFRKNKLVAGNFRQINAMTIHAPDLVSISSTSPRRSLWSRFTGLFMKRITA